MACESDKCEKYGLHHEYKDGVEVAKCFVCERDNQPERSKREDLPKKSELDSCGRFLDSCGGFLDRMRCSELGGNT